jgi:hypothetical protein
MECILKTGTGSATKTKSPKAHTNKLGCQHRIQIWNVHSVAANLTFHDNPSSGSFQLLQIGEQNGGVILLCTMQGCKCA